jgi:hypothetical protein
MRDSHQAATTRFADKVLEMPRAGLCFARRQLSMSWGPRLALLIILAVSLLLRVQGIERRPMMKFESLYQDEQKIVSNTLNLMRGKNILEHYPLALYYWLEPQFRIARTLTFWFEDVPKGRWLKRDADFVAHVAADPLPYYVLARANMTLFSMGISLLLFMLARALAGLGPALIVVALAGVMPLFVIYSKMAYYDLPMTFWYVVTLCVLFWTWKHGSLSGVYWSAALLAWTVCSKQNAVALAPLCFVTIIKVVAERSGRPWWYAWRSPHLWLSLVLGFVVLVWAYPALIDREALLRFVSLVRNRYYNVETDPRAPNWKIWIGGFWLRYAHLLILPLLAAGLPLLVWLTKQRTLALYIVAALALYFMVAGESKHSIDRTMLPMVPALLLGALGWALLAERYVQRPRWRMAATALVLAPAFVSLAFHTCRYNLLITCVDTRELAARWLIEHAPNSRVGTEMYGPLLPQASPSHYLADEGRPPVFFTESFGQISARSASHYARRKIDYLLLTQAYKQRKPVDANRPWVSNKKYDKLRAALPEVAAFDPQPPPAVLMSASKRDYRYSTWGTFFDWQILTSWLQRDSYVLGPPVRILRVAAP